MAKFPLLQRLSLQVPQSKRKRDSTYSTPCTPNVDTPIQIFSATALQQIWSAVPIKSATLSEPPQSATRWEDRYLSDLFQTEGSPDTPSKNIAKFNFGRPEARIRTSSRFSEGFAALREQDDDKPEVSSIDMATETESWPAALEVPRGMEPATKSKRFSTLSGRFSSAAATTDLNAAEVNRRHTFRNSMFSNWKRKSSISPPLLPSQDSMTTLSAQDCNSCTANRTCDCGPTSKASNNRRRSMFPPSTFDTYLTPPKTKRHSLQLLTNPLTTLTLKRTSRLQTKQSLDAQLLAACATGDLPSVGLLISAGCDPCRCDSASGLYPVHQAAAGGHIGTLKGLAAHGAKIDVRNRAGRTPLHVAVLNGRMDVVCWLVSVGACVDEGDKWGMTALHLAATLEDDEYEDVKKHDVPVNKQRASMTRALSTPDIHSRPWTKRTTSMPTIPTLPANSCLDTLIRAGADVNAVNERGDTPLHLAVKAIKVRNARALLDAGADINAKNREGLTPCNVLVSSEQRDLKLSRLLIERGEFADLGRDEEGEDEVFAKL